MNVGYYFSRGYGLRHMGRVCVVGDIRATTCFLTSARVGGHTHEHTHVIMNHRTWDRGRHPLGTGHPPLGETAGNASDRLAQLTSSNEAFACVEFRSKQPHVCSYAMGSMNGGYYFSRGYGLRHMERVCVVMYRL